MTMEIIRMAKRVVSTELSLWTSVIKELSIRLVLLCQGNVQHLEIWQRRSEELIRKLEKIEVIAENYFELFTSLWAVLSHRFRWNQDLFDYFFKICTALTNQHYSLHPMRERNAPFYGLYRKQLYRDGIVAVHKKARRKKTLSWAAASIFCYQSVHASWCSKARTYRSSPKHFETITGSSK